MKNVIVVFAFLCSVFSAQDLLAQSASQSVKEHEFLKKFVGEWDVESGGSGMTSKAIMKSSMLGDLWLINSSDHDMGSVQIKSLQTIGYDTTKKKFVGTWVDSMLNYMWQYEGTVDEGGKKITLDAKGPSMTGDGKMHQYRDAYEFKDADTIIATASMQDAEGNWKEIMKGTLKRRTTK